MKLNTTQQGLLFLIVASLLLGAYWIAILEGWINAPFTY